MKIKQRPEDFVVREGASFEADREGPVWVYRMDKQKVSTLQALERIGKEFGVRRRALSVCGLKDKQGRTEQLVGVEGGSLGMGEVVQSGDLRLTLIGRARAPLTSANVTANRFEVTVRDLTREEAERVPESAREVERTGIVNYFDSQRFGFLKHGQGFIGKQLIKGDFEGALKSFLATPSTLDKSDDAKVKQFWLDHWGDWRQFAPQKAGAIYAPILKQLRTRPDDFKGAFMHIERRQRMMAIFELQSYLWNEGVRRYLLALLPAAELIGLRYQAGALLLPRSIPPALREMLARKTFPLLAPDTTFTDPKVQAAAMSALTAQQLTLDKLFVPETPQLFFKHEERPLLIHPGKLRVSEARPDELNPRKLKITLSFTLPPGAYATLVVRRTLWFAAEGVREMGSPARGAGKPGSAPEQAGRGRDGSRGDARGDRGGAADNREAPRGDRRGGREERRAPPGERGGEKSRKRAGGQDRRPAGDEPRPHAPAPSRWGQPAEERPPARADRAEGQPDLAARLRAALEGNLDEDELDDPGLAGELLGEDEEEAPAPTKTRAASPGRDPRPRAQPERAARPETAARPHQERARAIEPAHKPAETPAQDTAPRGFLARQRARKEAKAARRDQAKKR